MESLNDAIRKRINDMGTVRAVSAAVILDQANKVLPKSVKATAWRNDVLTVTAERSVDAHFFKEDKDMYIEQLNAALYPTVVKDIAIRTEYRR